jgi:hypothetical protein
MEKYNDPLSVIKRRPVGKGAWRMTVQELIESERAGLQHLRAIGNLHPNDAETQRLIAMAAFGVGERLGALQELAHYKDGNDTNGSGPLQGGGRKGK